jgi:hypothetical protein
MWSIVVMLMQALNTIEVAQGTIAKRIDPIKS